MKAARSFPAVWCLALLGGMLVGPLGCGRREMAQRLERQWQGAELYERMCAVCHGRQGEGYAADQAPAIAHPAFLSAVTDTFLRNAIALGRTGSTMSAWGVTSGGPLSQSEVDAVIDFLRGWQRGGLAKLDARPRSGDAARGETLYARECSRCHGEHGTAGPNVRIGNPELLADASDGFLREAISHGRPGTAMAGFEQKLGDQGVEDLLALLRHWQSVAAPVSHAAPARVPPLPLGPVPLNPRGPEPVGFRAAGAVTAADAVKAQLDRGARMALLDARAPSDYVRGHIAGALSVPFYDPNPYVPALPKDVWYVCYCACPHAESSQLAQKLMAKGFKKVTVLDEGLGVWRARGYPTRTGLDP